MLRNDGWKRGLCVLLLGGAAVSGCKKEQPQASVSVDAGGVATAAVDAGVPDAGPVAKVAKVAKPLRFSDVVLKRAAGKVFATYTLTNPGTAQGRGDACLGLLDEQGVLIWADRLGNITVKGGTDDTFTDELFVEGSFWEQARTLLLFTAPEYTCSTGEFGAASEPLRVLPTGRPAPTNAPVPRRSAPLAKGELLLFDVHLEQPGGGDSYILTYTLKNTSARRITGNACLEGHKAHKEGAPLFTALVAEVSLAPGATETRSDSVYSVDDKDWDTVATLDLFVDDPACASASAEAAPTRHPFEKPEGIHSPEEEETGMDESDAYDPEEEFPQEPSPPDEETAD